MKFYPRQHPTTQFFTGRMPFLPPNQQRQSTEETCIYINISKKQSCFIIVTMDDSILMLQWHDPLQCLMCRDS